MAPVHQGLSPTDPTQLTVEGRLRRAVGDHWLGLGQLEQASLRLPPRQCQLAGDLEQELHTPAYISDLEQAAGKAGLAPPPGGDRQAGIPLQPHGAIPGGGGGTVAVDARDRGRSGRRPGA